MSRSNYDDSIDPWSLIRWRGAVKAAIRGKRGQLLLRTMRDALDAMPEKRLIPSALVTDDGDCCAMGAVAIARGIDVSDIDPEESDVIAARLNIAEAMAREIAYENDECLWGDDSPEARWKHMRKWVERQIVEGATPVEA